MIVKLQNVRLAFPNLFEARTVNGEGTPAYSASFILGANHPNAKEIEKAMKDVAAAKWGTKAEATLKSLKASGKVCFRDGTDKAEYDGFEGNFYISARSKNRPLVLDRDKSQLSQVDGRPYAGCFVNGSVEIWAQDNNFGKRINATLRGVQFFKDGDAFAGGAPASEDEFEDLGEGADAAADDDLA